MWVKYLESKGFRNFVDQRIKLDPSLNWLTGPNGQGKTNGLELLYFSLTGKSFRTSRLSELIRNTETQMAVSAGVRKADQAFEFGVEIQSGKVKRLLGGKPCKPMDFFKIGAAICFTARSKLLVEGPPDERRLFLDRMVATLDPEYIHLLARYRKTLTQLKQILHKSKDLHVYRSFKQALIPTAHAITQNRMNCLEQIRPRATWIYQNVFLGEGDLTFEYQLKNCQDLASLEKKMMDVCAKEVLYGRSLVGPHLDDLGIFVKRNRAKTVASSGQVRAIVLSMKLAIRESYKNKLGTYPILLLDDIDAELDSQRLGGLIKHVFGQGQTLISTSKYATIEHGGQGSVLNVTGWAY